MRATQPGVAGFAFYEVFAGDYGVIGSILERVMRRSSVLRSVPASQLISDLEALLEAYPVTLYLNPLKIDVRLACAGEGLGPRGGRPSGGALDT